MMNETYVEFLNLLGEIFAKNGIKQFVTSENIAIFYKFTKILLEGSEKTNLTAINNVRDIIIKHYADTLIAADSFDIGKTVIDIGCGAGFPSLPLAIARPDLKITALDSTCKKIEFVKNACQKLNLTNVTPICERAEVYIEKESMRECFDYATARAVSRLNVLSELALGFVKLGGKFIAMKAKEGATEAKEAEKGISLLGGETKELKQLILHDETGDIAAERTIVCVLKKEHTPTKYPRTYAKIIKNPL